MSVKATCNENCIQFMYMYIFYRFLSLYLSTGEGQFGKVYAAVNMETGELMALKEVSAQFIWYHCKFYRIRICMSISHVGLYAFQLPRDNKDNAYGLLSAEDQRQI